MAPTALALLGLPAAAGMRGRDLLEPSAGAQPEGCSAGPVIAESPAYGPDSKAVVWKGRKLIVRSDGVELLFDLRSDPGERNDLSARHPRLVAGLRQVLDRETAAHGEAEAAAPMPIDEETRRQLQALGYLE